MEDIRGIIRDLGEIREKACDLTEKMASKAREEGIADDLRAVKEKTGDIKAKFKTLKEDASKWEIRKKLGFTEVPLGELRYEKSRILKHREWRGAEDTAYDFYYWLLNWHELLKSAKTNPEAMKK